MIKITKREYEYLIACEATLIAGMVTFLNPKEQKLIQEQMENLTGTPFTAYQDIEKESKITLEELKNKFNTLTNEVEKWYLKLAEPYDSTEKNVLN